MYWVDGTYRPLPIPCSNVVSMARARVFALAHDLIEVQGRVAKSCVKMNNFDHWCIEASELVDLVMDLVRQDEEYLTQDGRTTRDESLRRISDQNSHFRRLSSRGSA